MPATATGRGAQVVVDPLSDTAKAIRGAYASTYAGNAAKVAADIAAGLAADGNGPDGSTRTGAMALDHAVQPKTGTTTNDNAQPGNVGEFLSATAAQGAVTLTSAAAATVTTLVLTPGDWDVAGLVSLSGTATAVTTLQIWVAQSTGRPTMPAAGMLSLQGNSPTTNDSLGTGYRRFSLAAPATAYLVCNVTFTGGTCLAGGVIQARRFR